MRACGLVVLCVSISTLAVSFAPASDPTAADTPASDESLRRLVAVSGLRDALVQGWARQARGLIEFDEAKSRVESPPSKESYNVKTARVESVPPEIYARRLADHQANLAETFPYAALNVDERERVIRKFEELAGAHAEQRAAAFLREHLDEKAAREAISFFETDAGRRIVAILPPDTKAPLLQEPEPGLAALEGQELRNLMDAARKATIASPAPGPGRNERRARRALRMIEIAEDQCRGTSGTGRYATLSALSAATPPYLFSDLAAGRKDGYSFVVTLGAGDSTFSVVARPLRPEDGRRTFFLDRSGIIHFRIGADATSADSVYE